MKFSPIYFLILGGSSPRNEVWSSWVLSLPKSFSVESHREGDRLHIHLDQAQLEDLPDLSHYDESWIRKILAVQRPSPSVDLEIHLKDPSLQTLIQHLEEPPRIIIEVFSEQSMPSSNPRPEPENKKNLENEISISSDVITSDAILKNVPFGRAPGWASYPSYIQPFSLFRFLPNKPEKTSEPLSNFQMLAFEGLRLSSLGHERQSLALYWQVLRHYPQIFDNPSYLFSLAETQLAHKNLHLAMGYYEKLIKKYPNIPLASYAAFRLLDLAYLSFPSSKENLLKSLDQISPKTPELQVWKTIRQAFWSTPSHSDDAPALSEKTYLSLEKNFQNLLDPQTIHISLSLIMKYLTDPKVPWNSALGQKTASYFHSSAIQGPFFEESFKNFQNKASDYIINLEKQSSYMEAIDFFSALSKDLQKVGDKPSVSWALAESFRKSSSFEKSVPFYKKSAQSDNKFQNFQSIFWSSQLSNKREDKLMFFWNLLSEKEQNDFLITHQDDFFQAIKNFSKWKSPCLIALAELRKGKVLSMTAPSSLVNFTKSLSQSLEKLGMHKESQEVLASLKNAKEESLKGENHNVWRDELFKLAESYGQDKQFFEAGETYVFTAENSGSWDHRAEALYKGGLLLYKAGKKNEAIHAFEMASEDGGNLFYANLAKERLSRIR